jgi:hypothetical protein
MQVKEWRALPPHVHHMTANLIGFLEETLTEIAAITDSSESGS